MKQTIIYTMPEYRLSVVREVTQNSMCDNPEKVYNAWKAGVETASWYSPLQEQCVVFMVNTKRKIIGFKLTSMGTLDSALIEPRDVFVPALLAGAKAIILTHNHPSGDSIPSDADVRVTKHMIEVGKLLKIDLLDHIIIGKGEKPWCSLRELGLFY